METQREYVLIEAGEGLVGLKAWTLRQYLTQGKLTRYKCGRRTLLDKAELLSLVKAETKEEATQRNIQDERRRAKDGRYATIASPGRTRSTRKSRRKRLRSEK
jgi:hypothetical protein